MNQAFKKPADAHAKNELTAFITYPLAPVALAVLAANILLIPRLMAIEEVHAAA